MLRRRAIEKQASFTFETVLSTDRNLELLDKAKSKGYFIRAYFVFTTDPMLNVSRVAARVASGGHNVPADKIISRYWRSRERLPRLLQISDICHVYDNTDNIPVRIVRKHKNELSLIANENWTLFKLQQLIYLEGLTAN